MRRWIAILLFFVISFPSLMQAAIFVPANSQVTDENKLPACCRRDGKHACAMRKTPAAGTDVSSLATNGAAAVRSRDCCPKCPAGQPATLSVQSPAADLAAPAFDLAVALTHIPVACAQTEIHYRISFSRSSQKRGPPAVL